MTLCIILDVLVIFIGIYAIRKTFQFSERLRIIFANQEKEEKKVGILWQIK